MEGLPRLVNAGCLAASCGKRPCSPASIRGASEPVLAAVLPPSALSWLASWVFCAPQTRFVQPCHLLPGLPICTISCCGAPCSLTRNLCPSFSYFKTLSTLLSVPKLMRFSLPRVLPAFGKGGLSDSRVTERSFTSCTWLIVFKCQKYTMGLPP